jgi:hypothetical protein
MSISFRALSARMVVAFFLTFLIFAPPLQADTTYDLIAKTTNAGLATTFTIRYDDTGDGKFELGEFVSWTGVTVSGMMLTAIHYVPVTGSSLLGGPADPNPGNASTWGFGYLDDPGWGTTYWSVNDWTYTQTPVPIPPSALLLGSGLLGLAGWRKFRKG